MFSPKSNSLIVMLANENYLDELQDTECKRTIINFIKEFKDFKEDTKRQLSGIKENKLKENERLE